jgi:sigma-B regulation protein RsbU (phosphoserine phosphatase)
MSHELQPRPAVSVERLARIVELARQAAGSPEVESLVEQAAAFLRRELGLEGARVRLGTDAGSSSEAARSAQRPVQAARAIPMRALGTDVGELELEGEAAQALDSEGIVLVESVAAILALALRARSTGGPDGDLERRLELETTMNEIGKEMTHILELEQLLNRIAVLMRRVIAYEILGIFLYRAESGLLELQVAIGYHEETIERIRTVRPGQGLLGHAALERKTQVTSDMAHDPRAIAAFTVDGRATVSEVAVPIVFRDRLLGAVVVESCDPRHFTPERVQVLETLASQMAVCIDNAQLFQQLLQKEQKLEADFALARDLQASMLPVTMPDLERFEAAAVYRPAESLGGDYYDFLWLDEGLLALAIGDVSGKGVAAAMTMAATRSALRFAARLHSAPSQVLYHVNRRLYRDVKKRTFVSLFYATLDVASGLCRWSNAGHYPPVLLRAAEPMVELDKGGMVLALFDKARYSSQQTQLEPGDLLVCYTDGVIEARNTADEEFGKERLIEFLRHRRGSTAREVVRAVTGELKKFTRGAPQHDDITLLALKGRESSG